MLGFLSPSVSRSDQNLILFPGAKIEEYPFVLVTE